MDNSLLPLTVYGSNISYFTGKLETYLRAKGIPYQLEPMLGPRIWRLVERETGAGQMPAVQLADGRWMTDTTPMIAWLEKQSPDPPIVPRDPVQLFFSLLLEDYADEWLWRPAMHYRWYSAAGAMFASRHLAEELLTEIPVPGMLKRWNLRRRQRGYTTGDGVDEGNRSQVEAIYLNNLAWLNGILEQRMFLLGNSPSLVDIAFMGPMLRHFSQDPVPAEIMRLQAPAVFEWVARLWNGAPKRTRGDWVSGVPEDWNVFLDDIGAIYLPYLCDNADAVAAGKKRFASTVGGACYHNAMASPYRVWGLGQLREHFTALSQVQQDAVQARLEAHGCWEPLWRSQLPEHLVNQGIELPFGSNAKML